MPTCSICYDRPFSTARALKQHLRTTTDYHPYCDVCNKNFSGLHGYDMHMASVHPHVRGCGICNVRYRSHHDLNQHYYDSPSHPTCYKCNVGLKTRHDLIEHNKVLHVQLRCELCKLDFEGATGDLQSHYLISPSHPKCFLHNLGFKNDQEYDLHALTHLNADIRTHPIEVDVTEGDSSDLASEILPGIPGRGLDTRGHVATTASLEPITLEPTCVLEHLPQHGAGNHSPTVLPVPLHRTSSLQSPPTAAVDSPPHFAIACHHFEDVKPLKAASPLSKSSSYSEISPRDSLKLQFVVPSGDDHLAVNEEFTFRTAPATPDPTDPTNAADLAIAWNPSSDRLGSELEPHIGTVPRYLESITSQAPLAKLPPEIQQIDFPESPSVPPSAESRDITLQADLEALDAAIPPAGHRIRVETVSRRVCVPVMDTYFSSFLSAPPHQSPMTPDRSSSYPSTPNRSPVLAQSSFPSTPNRSPVLGQPPTQSSSFPSTPNRSPVLAQSATSRRSSPFPSPPNRSPGLGQSHTKLSSWPSTPSRSPALGQSIVSSPYPSTPNRSPRSGQPAISCKSSPYPSIPNGLPPLGQPVISDWSSPYPSPPVRSPVLGRSSFPSTPSRSPALGQSSSFPSTPNKSHILGQLPTQSLSFPSTPNRSPALGQLAISGKSSPFPSTPNRSPVLGQSSSNIIPHPASPTSDDEAVATNVLYTPHEGQPWTPPKPRIRISTASNASHDHSSALTTPSPSTMSESSEPFGRSPSVSPPPGLARLPSISPFELTPIDPPIYELRSRTGSLQITIPEHLNTLLHLASSLSPSVPMTDDDLLQTPSSLSPSSESDIPSEPRQDGEAEAQWGKEFGESIMAEQFPLPDSVASSPIDELTSPPSFAPRNPQNGGQQSSCSMGGRVRFDCAPMPTALHRKAPLQAPGPLALAANPSTLASEPSVPQPRLHCRVCQRDPCVDITATMCGHIFCYGCITDSVIKTSKCPQCATPTLLYCLFRLDLSA